MRKIILLTVILIVVAMLPVMISSCNSSSGENDMTETQPADVSPKPPENPIIHSISELNTEEYDLDSAAGNEGRASLAKDFRASYTLTPKDLGVGEAYYSRIKRIDDIDSYIMIFHHGLYGGSVYCSKSNDCIKWSKATTVFAQDVVNISGTPESLKYMTPDACVLSDGRIICVTAYRAEMTYYSKLEENGIAISFSEDNGKTWSAPKTVYKGLCWEPSVLEAENGEIYIYFTAIAPTIYLYGYGNHSAGVGLIRSKDGGNTWTPDVMSAPFLPQYVMRQYVYTNDAGIKIFNDGMPVARQLHNGVIALTVETNEREHYTFSISYNDDGYKEDLGLERSGPENRQTQLFDLAGPYLAQFDSGETVLTYHWAGTMRYRLGTADAKQFFDENIILTDVGMWGSVEVISSHSAVMTMGTDDWSIKVATVYLNHDIIAKKMTPSMTGNTEEWDDNTDAIFVSGSCQAQTSVRLAHDSNNIYVLCERLDDYITDKDGIEFYISDNEGGQYVLSATGDDFGVKHQEDSKSRKKDVDYKEEGFGYRITKCGTENDNEGTDGGIIYEFSIPKRLLNQENDEVFYRVVMFNKDSEYGPLRTDDSNPSAGPDNTDNWSRAFLR